MERRRERGGGAAVMLALLAVLIAGLFLWMICAGNNEKPSDRAVLVYSEKEALRWSRDA